MLRERGQWVLGLRVLWFKLSDELGCKVVVVCRDEMNEMMEM